MATFNYKTYLAIKEDFCLVYVGFDKFSFGYAFSYVTSQMIPATLIDLKYI